MSLENSINQKIIDENYFDKWHVKNNHFRNTEHNSNRSFYLNAVQNESGKFDLKINVI